MGRAKKGKKYTLTNNNDDPASGDDEKLSSHKRRGRPQKPLTDDIDEDVGKTEEDDEEHDHEDENGNSDAKKRKRVKPVKEKGDLVKHESTNGTKSMVFVILGVEGKTSLIAQLKLVSNADEKWQLCTRLRPA